MPSEPATSSKWGDLSQRMLSGGLAAAVGLWLMWVGGIPFKLLISGIVGLMVWEVARMMDGGKLAMPFGVLASVVMVALALLPTGLALPLLFLPALIGMAQLGRYRVRFALFATAILLSGIGLFALREDFGFLWMLWLALVVIFSDVLGYTPIEPVKDYQVEIVATALDWPYNTVHDAIVDGWQVIQFPHLQAPFDDQDLDVVGYEFILQKIEVIK